MVAAETGCGVFLSFSLGNQNYLVNASLKLDLANEYISSKLYSHISLSLTLCGSNNMVRHDPCWGWAGGCTAYVVAYVSLAALLNSA